MLLDEELGHADADAARESEGQALENADHRGRRGGDDEERQRDGVEAAVERSDEDAGQCREPGCDGPRDTGHPVGVDAHQLRHLGAVDDGAHADAERGVPQECEKRGAQREHDEDGCHLGQGGVDAAHGPPVAGEQAVGGERGGRAPHDAGENEEQDDESDPLSGHGWLCRLVDAEVHGAAGFVRVRKAELEPA